MIATYRVHDLQDDSVRDMSTVPRQQKVHPVDGSKCEVQRIGGGFVGQRGSPEDSICEDTCFGSDPKDRKAADELQSRLRRLNIAPTDLEENQFRDVKLEPMPLPVPPLTRKLLMSQTHDIAARPRRQITDDVAVEVGRCSHSRKLLHITERRESPRSTGPNLSSASATEERSDPARKALSRRRADRPMGRGSSLRPGGVPRDCRASPRRRGSRNG